jgi:hypothetical protein
LAEQKSFLGQQKPLVPEPKGFLPREKGFVGQQQRFVPEQNGFVVQKCGSFSTGLARAGGFLSEGADTAGPWWTVQGQRAEVPADGHSFAGERAGGGWDS